MSLKVSLSLDIESEAGVTKTCPWFDWSMNLISLVLDIQLPFPWTYLFWHGQTGEIFVNLKYHINLY
jgi:hypothetical protein